jgi:hypothetical protein
MTFEEVIALGCKPNTVGVDERSAWRQIGLRETFSRRKGNFKREKKRQYKPGAAAKDE